MARNNSVSSILLQLEDVRPDKSQDAFESIITVMKQLFAGKLDAENPVLFAVGKEQKQGKLSMLVNAGKQS